MFEHSYDRKKAVQYAHRWAYSRNPRFYNFDEIGGDCTNFTSQCLYAGGGVMNMATNGWYYRSLNNRAPAWTGVSELYDFLLRNKGPGPFAEEVSIHEVKPGDIVQLLFSGGKFQHSPFIVSTGPDPAIGNILVSAHTYDADNRPLDSYIFKEVRFIHIKGFRG